MTTAVCLHGFLGSPDDWRDFERAAGGVFRVVSLDLPGRGARRPDAIPTSLAAWADALAPVVRRAAPDVLVGYSLGGRAALALALAHPDVVPRLVLVSSSPGLMNDSERAGRAALDSHRAGLLRRDPARFLDEWYGADLFAPLRATAVYPAVRAARAACLDPAAAADVLEALSPGREPSRWHELPRLVPPVTFVAGSRDLSYVETGRRAAAAAREGRFVSVPGAGHALHFEAPDALAGVVAGVIGRG